jgi:hypothetical protein
MEPTITAISSVLHKVPVVNLLTAFAKTYQAQQHYVARWEALNIIGHDWIPMEGASLTIITAPTPWSTSLEVHAHDITRSGRREHSGKIEIDLAHPTVARRIVIYNDQEISQQQIEVIDRNHLLVIPAEPGYLRHILRRVNSQLGLT